MTTPEVKHSTSTIGQGYWMWIVIYCSLLRHLDQNVLTYIIQQEQKQLRGMLDRFYTSSEGVSSDGLSCTSITILDLEELQITKRSDTGID